MNWFSIVKAELRKLTSTKMPLGFVLVFLAIGGATAAAVAFGTDMDGSKTFISTAQDQQSLMAFAPNALIIAALFGAVAVAREYAHGTAILTYLTTPRRTRAFAAQLAAIFIAGFVLGLIGAGISGGSVAVGLIATDYGFMVPTADLVQVLASSAVAGALGAVMGAGLGALARNSGGAVTGVIVLLMILPPLAVQVASESASWVPDTLAKAVSGVDATVGVAAALAAMVVWAVIPAAAGMASVVRRDVV